jgi:hypothetical protein
MAVGEIITAARYNSMQAKAIAVLGNGSGNLGYGQRPVSTSVALTNTVNALHMQNLKSDLEKAYVHQTGSLPTLTNIVASTDEITDTVYAQYENISTFVYAEINRFALDSSQATVENKLSSQRVSAWGGASQPQTVRHEFTVTFTGGYTVINSDGTSGTATAADHRRHFFNSGGEIRIVPSISSPPSSTSKFIDWQNLLQSIGTLRFNYTTVTASSGISSSLGNFDLTSTYQTLYTKSGTSVYTGNTFVVKAKGAQTSGVVTFLVEFTDDLSNNVDEPVEGTLLSSISQYRATGSYVSVPSPVYQTIQSL